jgi:hypothetical protein
MEARPPRLVLVNRGCLLRRLGDLLLRLHLNGGGMAQRFLLSLLCLQLTKLINFLEYIMHT